MVTRPPPDASRSPTKLQRPWGQTRWVWALVGLGLLYAPHTLARDMTGKASIGALVTNSGMPMLALRYWRTDLAVELTAGWASRDVRLPDISVQNGVEQSKSGAAAAEVERCVQEATDPAARTDCSTDLALTSLRLGFGLLYRIGDARQASLAVGMRPWVQIDAETRSDTQTTTSTTEVTTARTTTDIGNLPLRFGIEIPLQAEAFLTDHFSVVGSVALSIQVGRLPQRSNDRPSRRTTANDFWFGSSGGFGGGAGMSYYF
jgi:hypothetical protein